MRILGIGAKVELGDLYLSLQREGHDVRVFAGDPSYAGCFEIWAAVNVRAAPST